MKKNYVTMVNPQQIVNKGLKGCRSTRTVTTFAQKYGVPCCYWNPTRNQKVLLVDWTQFRTAWNQYYQPTRTTTTNSRFAFTKPATRTTTGTTAKKTTPRTTSSTRTGTTRRVTATNRNNTRTSMTRATTYSRRPRRAA